jgi:hypothetical protein
VGDFFCFKSLSLGNSKEATVWIKVLPSRRQTSPQQVLERTLDYVKEKNLKKRDEIWLVIDRDEWSTAQLEDVFSKCQPLDFHLAVSNPKFEYWLLLHFEDGKGIKSPESCSKKLLQHLPNYKKNHLEIHKLYPRISDAIRRAKEKDQPPCKKWPGQNGSTVYLLVEKLYVDTACQRKENL